MLVGDYYTYDVKSTRSGGSPHCRSCSDPNSREDLTHILTQCVTYSQIRERMIPEFEEVLTESESRLNIEEGSKTDENLCQFILDPSSLNLRKRINISDPALHKLFKLSRSYCYAINSEQVRNLTKKEL